MFCEYVLVCLFEINITRQHLFGKIMSAMTQHPFKTKRKKWKNT